MSAETLLQEVLRKRDEQLAQLEREYSQKIDQVRLDLERKVSQVHEETQRLIREQTERVRNMVLSSARLKAKKIILEARESSIRANMNKLTSVLQEYVRSDSYQDVLKSMLDYARRVLGEEFVVACRKEDLAFFKANGVRGKEAESDPMGGATFTSSDGRMVLDLRLEELIRINEDKLRSSISTHLEQN